MVSLDGGRWRRSWCWFIHRCCGTGTAGLIFSFHWRTFPVPSTSPAFSSHLLVPHLLVTTQGNLGHFLPVLLTTMTVYATVLIYYLYHEYGWFPSLTAILQLCSPCTTAIPELPCLCLCITTLYMYYAVRTSGRMDTVSCAAPT
jgi:hypothetical protein